MSLTVIVNNYIWQFWCSNILKKKSTTLLMYSALHIKHGTELSLLPMPLSLIRVVSPVWVWLYLFIRFVGGFHGERHHKPSDFLWQFLVCHQHGIHYITYGLWMYDIVIYGFVSNIVLGQPISCPLSSINAMQCWIHKF